LNRTIRQALELEAAAGLNGFGRPAGYKYHFTDFAQMHQEAAIKNPHGYRYDLSTLPRPNLLVDTLRVANPRHLGAKIIRRLTGTSHAAK
jgi:hypothetical protein